MPFGMGVGLGLGKSSLGASTPWSPSTASIPLVGQYKSDVISGATWTDQSGVGNHITLANTSAGANLNGRATLSFNGFTSTAIKASFALGGTGAISIAVVTNPSADASYQALASYHAGGEYHEVLVDQGTNKGAIYNGAVLAGATDIVGAWKRLVVTEVVGGNQILYVENVSDATHAAAGAISNSLDFSVGTRPDGSLTVHSPALFAEVLVWRGVLSSTDRTNLHTYLGTAWAL